MDHSYKVYQRKCHFKREMTDNCHFLPINGGGLLLDGIPTMNTFLIKSVEWIILISFIGENVILTEK